MTNLSDDGARHSPSGLDEVSRRLIELLQADGRQSYATMAKEVGLSEAAVRQRVQRLREAGVIQIVAVTDPMQVGFRRQAMVGIKASGDLAALAAAITELPEASYVVTTAGAFDVLVELVCENDDQLFTLLNDRIRALAGVWAVEAFVYLRLNKQHYDWGTR